MSIFYIDLVGGNDSNDGSSWANAWKTISGGATAARIAPGDTIRISKTPDPVSIGNGKWTLNTQASGGFPATKSISATANSSGLIKITTSSAHGYSTGDVVQIMGLLGTVEANGAWVITYIDTTNFTLDDSVYVNARTSGGAAQLVSSKAIVLETANTKMIDHCQSTWNSGVDATGQTDTSYPKHGRYAVSVVIDSTPTANSIQAYHATGALDLSAYQYISFWFRNSQAIANVNSLTVTLCSNADGTGVVDTFVIPIIPSVNRWIPLTIARTGGGNLGSNIASIAVNTGSSPTSGSMTFNDFGEIIATKTNGINLQSLISKNGSAQGGTGAAYGIQSINGKVILVDNDTNTLSNAGRGYYETSETCTTYIRETYKTALASSSSTVVSELLDSGTLGNLISYEFGYEVGTTNQNGETFLDGLNGLGHGVYANAKKYNSLNLCNIYRYNRGLYFIYCSNNQINSINNLNSNTEYGIYLNGSHNYAINKLLINNNGYGIYLNSSHNNKITLISGVCNNANYGYYSSYSFNNVVNNASAFNNSTGIYLDLSNNTNFLQLSSGLNTTAIDNDDGTNYIRDAVISESTSVSGMSLGSKAELWSIKEDGTEGNNWGYFYGSTYNWQTTTKYGTQPGAGKITITSSERNTAYKIPIKVAEIACEADKLVTVKAWVKKDHATNVACQLRVDTDVVTGVTGTTTAKADDTNWEELTLTFTPDFQSVVELFFDSWYVGGNSNTYIGTISVSQAL